mmetsp:Transcript_91676/g.258344  ORF Transcript_91676/g.258344 Transcript_91676/m.258344 type:complete len:234 (+) Transcript_91676:111-812(+)
MGANKQTVHKARRARTDPGVPPPTPPLRSDPPPPRPPPKAPPLAPLLPSPAQPSLAAPRVEAVQEKLLVRLPGPGGCGATTKSVSRSSTLRINHCASAKLRCTVQRRWRSSAASEYASRPAAVQAATLWAMMEYQPCPTLRSSAAQSVSSTMPRGPGRAIWCTWSVEAQTRPTTTQRRSAGIANRPPNFRQGPKADGWAVPAPAQPPGSQEDELVELWASISASSILKRRASK